MCCPINFATATIMFYMIELIFLSLSANYIPSCNVGPINLVECIVINIITAFIFSCYTICYDKLSIKTKCYTFIYYILGLIAFFWTTVYGSYFACKLSYNHCNSTHEKNIIFITVTSTQLLMITVLLLCNNFRYNNKIIKSVKFTNYNLKQHDNKYVAVEQDKISVDCNIGDSNSNNSNNSDSVFCTYDSDSMLNYNQYKSYIQTNFMNNKNNIPNLIILNDSIDSIDLKDFKKETNIESLLTI